MVAIMVWMKSRRRYCGASGGLHLRQLQQWGFSDLELQHQEVNSMGTQ
jgi:hypothetical protein